VVLIAGGEEEWTGSGRSISPFDLHGALGACADHLGRWGGHRAAAGLSIRPESIGAFADAFAAHATGVLTEDDLIPIAHVDAAVDGRELALELCEELARLAPFGLGNPAVRLLVGGCEVAELTAVGENGKHLRVGLRMNGRPLPGGIAFGRGSQLDALRRPLLYDVVFKLSINRWNGTEAPELRIEGVFETAEGYAGLRAKLADEWPNGADAWSEEVRAIFTELGLDEGGRWRSLFESPTFLAALEEPMPLAA
jgi:single-stranded-DNA-specific exonuclease